MPTFPKTVLDQAYQDRVSEIVEYTFNSTMKNPITIKAPQSLIDQMKVIRYEP